jgi:hypothetical protein
VVIAVFLPKIQFTNTGLRSKFGRLRGFQAPSMQTPLKLLDFIALILEQTH